VPLYYFQCPGCGRKERRLLSTEEVEVQRYCICGKVLVRTPKGSQAQVVETLDNGVMIRKLTRPADAERIHRERSLKFDREMEENK